MSENKLSFSVRVGRLSYLVLAALFVICVIIQVYFAGLAAFFYEVTWENHTHFVHLFGFNIPVFMLISLFISRMPRWGYWQVFGILGLIFLMYFSANVSALGAIHPVIALLLFMLSVYSVVKTFRYVFRHTLESWKNRKENTA